MKEHGIKAKTGVSEDIFLKLCPALVYHIEYCSCGDGTNEYKHVAMKRVEHTDEILKGKITERNQVQCFTYISVVFDDLPNIMYSMYRFHNNLLPITFHSYFINVSNVRIVELLTAIFRPNRSFCDTNIKLGINKL